MKEPIKWEGSWKLVRQMVGEFTTERPDSLVKGDVITSDVSYTPDFYVSRVEEDGSIWGFIV